MGTAKVELADDNATYFHDMARHYRSLAMAEQHQLQSDLFATIAADYGELAATAGQPQHTVAASEPAEASAFSRWVARWRRPARTLAAPLPLPVAPTAAK
jgi:hypothetical protein